ncbi:MAG: cell division protein FtsZ [Thermoplasmataceae archaeon]|jgi:cell division protein FtsZ
MTDNDPDYEYTEDFKGTSDEELDQFAVGTGATIKVFGMGGGGSNSVNRLYREKIPGIDLIACNTDSNHLLRIKAKNKILLGENLTRGQGAGGDPRIGEEAARESEKMFVSFMKGAEIVFITAGLGGGTGTGSAPYAAKIAKEQGALTFGVVTLPFEGEGIRRMRKAVWGLKRLIPACDCVIVITNETLLTIAPDLPVDKSFRAADEVIVKAIKAITEILSYTRLINLDMKDLEEVVKNSGAAVIGIGYGTGEYGERVRQAVKDALASPFLDLDLSTATGVLINISASDPTIDETNIATEEVRKLISDKAKIIMGTGIDKSLDKKIQVTLIVTGLKLPSSILDLEGTEEGGIDFIS